ncbi:WhiB family transcriptional regulator (plasmid) [Streptomyces sp. NBC_00053]|uniref:WhiB family transcriptional regulator n=1 Tax=Streptomyces sanglieri TaxID=193460 RepID=A0ABW2WKA2_9ACTN|nr:MULTISPECIES: WhiB family transcriptional regulator [unclassified Streptomyces]MCX4399995.1 WhiB family transcriptional regulator [Streptomyces sp. NBC_01767]MCX5106895.1 WhiB family transcriptional regulator [Streptomyces sp. NBC_00439]MCX5506002.1 WhiB family transcriptional regulator [Streptomyces sp. NBC_00052]MCX5554343.1 WhiB family transcriptional regulator [Streptomyces sp. NBC_00051]
MTLSRISPKAARLARRPVLQAAVAASARCGDQERYRELLDRNRSAPPVIWVAQQAAAERLCSGCPVRPACEELALRYGEGDRNSDDLVRGGRRGQELAVDREIRQSGRLAAAIATDWQHLLELNAAAREEFTLTYVMESGPVTKTGLRRDAVERVGAMALRAADRGEVWDIAVHDAAGVDVADDFDFAHEDYGSLPAAA